MKHPSYFFLLFFLIPLLGQSQGLNLLPLEDLAEYGLLTCLQRVMRRLSRQNTTC